VTTHRIAVLGGDGIGPEVVAEGLKVLDRLEELEGFTTERVDYDLGGRRYLATGEVLDDATLDELRASTRSTSARSGPRTCRPG
jgi:3-isopropylmalate dehydrogenase